MVLDRAQEAGKGDIRPDKERVALEGKVSEDGAVFDMSASESWPEAAVVIPASSQVFAGSIVGAEGEEYKEEPVNEDEEQMSEND